MTMAQKAWYWVSTIFAVGLSITWQTSNLRSRGRGIHTERIQAPCFGYLLPVREALPLCKLHAGNTPHTPPMIPQALETLWPED